MPRTLCLIPLLFILILAVSCEKDKSALIDGYYSAEAADFDSYGWKEYLTICVSNKRIIFVEYNAHNPSGFIKSWDMDYMRQMNSMDGTYPNEYSRHYARQFLETQTIKGIDAITGATNSYKIFITLADAVMARAREGNSNTVLVHFKEPH